MRLFMFLSSPNPRVSFFLDYLILPAISRHIVMPRSTT